MSEIIIYTKSTCPFCRKAKSLLENKGAKYQEFDIGVEPELRSKMIEKANGKTTVPQIFIGDNHIGGCDDLYELEHAGKLDKLLQ